MTPAAIPGTSRSLDLYRKHPDAFAAGKALGFNEGWHNAANFYMQLWEDTHPEEDILDVIREARERSGVTGAINGTRPGER